jgi:hypothetical protein
MPLNAVQEQKLLQIGRNNLVHRRCRMQIVIPYTFVGGTLRPCILESICLWIIQNLRKQSDYIIDIDRGILMTFTEFRSEVR